MTVKIEEFTDIAISTLAERLKISEDQATQLLMEELQKRLTQHTSRLEE